MSEHLAKECLYNLDLGRAFRIYITVHEMLADRGYSPETDMMTKKAWISRYLGYIAEVEDDQCSVFDVIDNMALIFLDADDPDDRVLVYFYPLDSKLCQNDMNYIHKIMTEKEAQQLIIVSNNNATPKVSNVLSILGQSAQLFNEQELVFNVTKHQLVPRHELVSEKEKQKILDTYTVLPDGNQHPEFIPGMFTTDPIAKYYNFAVGDLIKIHRPRRDGFTDLTFRIITYPMEDEK